MGADGDELLRNGEQLVGVAVFSCTWLGNGSEGN